MEDQESLAVVFCRKEGEEDEEEGDEEEGEERAEEKVVTREHCTIQFE